MIITSECENCTYSIINDMDRSKVKVYCKIKDKTYYYGQCIPCEYKEIKDNIKKNMNN